MKSLLSPGEKAALLAACIAGKLPDARGRFGPFGGRYIPETLVPAFERLEEGARRYLGDENFVAEYHAELRDWVGRPTALTFARPPGGIPSRPHRNVRDPSGSGSGTSLA